MRKTNTLIVVPKNKYEMLRNFSLGLLYPINEKYSLACNQDIPDNIRSIILEGLLCTSYETILTQKDEVGGYYFKINQDIFNIKKGRKNIYGYEAEELRLITESMSLIQLIGNEDKEEKILSLITGVSRNIEDKVIKFYLNLEVLKILFNEHFQAIETFSMNLCCKSNSPKIDMYIDLFSKHFIEGFYNMLPFLENNNYKQVNFVNNTIKLVSNYSNKKILMLKDLKDILIILKYEKKRVAKFIDSLMDKINIETHKFNYESVPYFGNCENDLLTKLSYMEIHFEKNE